MLFTKTNKFTLGSTKTTSDNAIRTKLGKIHWKLQDGVYVTSINSNNSADATRMHNFFSDIAKSGRISEIEDTDSRIHAVKQPDGKTRFEIRLTPEDMKGLGIDIAKQNGIA